MPDKLNKHCDKFRTNEDTTRKHNYMERFEKELSGGWSPVENVLTLMGGSYSERNDLIIDNASLLLSSQGRGTFMPKALELRVDDKRQ